MRLKICTKTKDEEVSKIHKEFIINTKGENIVPVQSFLMDTIREEVKVLPKGQLMKYKKICQRTLAIFVLTFLANPMSNRALANGLEEQQQVDIQLQGIPSEIIQVGLVLIGICVAVSTILAIVLSQIAGGFRMFRREKMATEWTTDIIRGYTQILLAPVIITVIAFVTFLLFKDFKWFITPF